MDCLDYIDFKVLKYPMAAKITPKTRISTHSSTKNGKQENNLKVSKHIPNQSMKEIQD
jgi:hypothetical protein